MVIPERLPGHAVLQSQGGVVYPYLSQIISSVTSSSPGYYLYVIVSVDVVCIYREDIGLVSRSSTYCPGYIILQPQSGVICPYLPPISGSIICITPGYYLYVTILVDVVCVHGVRVDSVISKRLPGHAVL